MSSAFQRMKARRAQALEELNSKIQEYQSGGKNNEEDGYWKLSTDDAGNGSAVIRFLPQLEDEPTPWVRTFRHAFQGPSGLWYIENCLSTIGKTDPVNELNNKLWATKTKENQDKARNQKRKMSYISNIYVVKDPANPENEGKVFLFKYGKKIFDMIQDVMSPEFEDETPVNPFDLWEGANFKLKRRIVEKWPNYEKSSFDSPEPLSKDESKLEEIYSQVQSLQALVSPENFKSYDELKARLDRVLGNTSGPVHDEQEDEFEAPQSAIDTSEEVPETSFDSSDEEMEELMGLLDED